MGIQTANSLHAAGQYIVTGDDPDEVRSQSPNGLLITRFVIEGETDITWFQIQLEQPLDVGSCVYAVHGFQSIDPATEEDFSNAFVPFLVHVTDTEKLLFLLEEADFPTEGLDLNFAIQFTNFQSNLTEQLQVPVEIVGP